MSGSRAFIRSLKSFVAAATPVVAYSTLPMLPIVCGNSVPRTRASARIEVASSPLPASGRSISSTVPSGLMRVEIGARTWPLASARRLSSRTCAWTFGAVTGCPRSTTTAGVGAPGNALIMRS